MPVQVDSSRLPLVLIRFEGTLSDEELAGYLAQLTREVISQRQPYGMIFDAQRVAGVTAKQRRMQAEWMAEHEDALRRHSVGNAFVITSPLIRGALTAILWVRPMPGEHVVVSTVQEAERWVTDRLKARGLSVPGTSRSA